MTEIHVQAGAVGNGGTLPTLKAAADIAKSGDVVIVHEGVYRETLRPAAGTTWAAAEGERPVLDGGWNGKPVDWASANADLVLVRAADVTLRGLEIRNVAGQGVAVAAGGDGATVEACEIHHTFKGGAVVNGTGTPVVGVTFRQCHLHDISLSGQWQETPVNGCFRFASAHDALVEDCLIERGYGEGIDAGSRSIGVTFRRVTVRDIRHLMMYVNRARDVLFEDCIAHQAGLAAFRQGDGDVGAGLVVGDEESGEKDDRWQHSENVVMRGCLVVNAGALFTLRNNRKVGSTGKADGYNTTIRNLTIEDCTFVAGPDTRSGVVVNDNPWGDGNVAGTMRRCLFVFDALAGDAYRNGAAGFKVEDSLWSGVLPVGLPASNRPVAATALVNPFASLDGDFNIDNYRPRAGGPLDGAEMGALEALPVDPPVAPPVDPPDWAALLALAAEVDAHLATTILAAADTNRALLALKAKIVESKAA